MVALLQVLNSVLTTTMPIIACVLLTRSGALETSNTNPWAFWATFVPVGLLVFFLEVINHLEHRYPDSTPQMLHALLAPYALLVLEWGFFGLTIHRLVIGSGVVYIITTVLGFAMAVIGGPWLSREYTDYTSREWAEYAVVTTAQLLFIIPGGIVVSALLPVFFAMNRTTDTLNFVLLAATLLINSILQTRYVLLRSIYSSRTPERQPD